SDTPALVETLLVPFQVQGMSVGTVWVIAHDDTLKFEREDLRLLTALSEFASVAYQVLQQGAQTRDALAQERAGAKLLQTISTGLVQEKEERELYEQILDAAIAIMRADFGSMQMSRSGGDELQLIAWKGFHPVS